MVFQSLLNQLQTEEFQYYRYPYIIFGSFLFFTLIYILIHITQICRGSVQNLSSKSNNKYAYDGDDEFHEMNHLNLKSDRGSVGSVTSRATKQSVKRRQQAMQDEDWDDWEVKWHVKEEAIK